MEVHLWIDKEIIEHLGDFAGPFTTICRSTLWQYVFPNWWIISCLSPIINFPLCLLIDVIPPNEVPHHGTWFIQGGCNVERAARCRGRFVTLVFPSLVFVSKCCGILCLLTALKIVLPKTYLFEAFFCNITNFLWFTHRRPGKVFYNITATAWCIWQRAKNSRGSFVSLINKHSICLSNICFSLTAWSRKTLQMTLLSKQSISHWRNFISYPGETWCDIVFLTVMSTCLKSLPGMIATAQQYKLYPAPTRYPHPCSETPSSKIRDPSSPARLLFQNTDPATFDPSSPLTVKNQQHGSRGLHPIVDLAWINPTPTHLQRLFNLDILIQKKN